MSLFMVFRLFEVRNLFGIPPEFLRAVVAAAEEFIYGFGHLLGIAVVLLLRQGHAADRRAGGQYAAAAVGLRGEYLRVTRTADFAPRLLSQRVDGDPLLGHDALQLATVLGPFDRHVGPGLDTVAVVLVGVGVIGGFQRRIVRIVVRSRKSVLFERTFDALLVEEFRRAAHRPAAPCALGPEERHFGGVHPHQAEVGGREIRSRIGQRPVFFGHGDARTQADPRIAFEGRSREIFLHARIVVTLHVADDVGSGTRIAVRVPAVLFIFTIGIQAGPGFFDSFRSKGKTLILITMLIICSACLTAVGLKYAFDIDTPSVVGLIAGALTSTPGLAVAIDSTHSPLASIAYGIAYPFGVIGVILFVKLLPKIMRVDLDKEARRLEIERRGQFPELITCIYRITNSNVFNRSLMQINARGMTGAVISRLKHSDEISIPTASTVLHEGDYIQAVGSEESLNQLAVLVGEREEGELPLDKTQEIESLLLTKKDMINKQLGDLNLQKNFGCTVTRIRRSGIDLSPSPDLALKFGDKLMVVGEKEGLKGIARLLGNNAKKLSDTDFFPIAMGIVLGVLFGKINISFSESLSFSPGLTGGVLMVALVLSAIGKTGPIIWSMSGPANQLLRQLGLLLFLAEVGTSAGKNLVATFQESGLLMFGVGAAITLVPMLIATVVGRLIFKISLLDLLGTITGGMTSTPGLAAADSMVDSNIPSVAYATVYPIAMVFLILFIQMIASAVY